MIEPRYANLQSLFADRVFRIPHYQRFYSWQSRQRSDLFSDLTKLSTRAPDQHHFMATIVCHKTPETKNVGTAQYRVYDIVDGQQRMTTLIILLKAIELALPATSEDRSDLAKILVKRDGHLILLQTNNANELIFNRFLRDGTVPTASELITHSDTNLATAIADCIRYVGTWTKANQIADLMSLVLHRLGFVVYDTEDSRIVYTVFEVLNSRGLAVDWLDKAKSILMGQAFELASSAPAAEAEITALQKVWGELYREMAKVSVSGTEILRVAATLHYGSSSSKPLSADESLERIRQACNTWDKPRQISEMLLDIARKLVSIHGNLALGPASEILHARILAVAILSATHVTDNERQGLLNQWERVSFRIFGLYGKDARTKVGDYVRLATSIAANKLGFRAFADIKKELIGLGNEYPIEQAVREGLTATDCYEKSPEFCRYVLWSYEEGLASALGPGATVDVHERNTIWKMRATDSVEHVFPQNPWSEPAWKGKMSRPGGPPENLYMHVGRIGNLTLLPIVLNQQARASAFDKKKLIYAKHNLRMIKDIVTSADWTLVEIEAREAKIIAWAKTRWSDL